MINFELNNNDIKKSLKNKEFCEKYNIKYKEALFIRYLNESKDITVEQIEMLTNKYKISNRVSISNLSINNEMFKDDKESYGLFNNYLKNIKFDKYGLFEVILAAKANYYEKERFLTYDTYMVDALYRILFLNDKDISLDNFRNLRYLNSLEKEYCEVLKNHELANLIQCGDDDYYYTSIGKKRAEKELEEYSKIYGKDKVNKIKEYVIEQHDRYLSYHKYY